MRWYTAFNGSSLSKYKKRICGKAAREGKEGEWMEGGREAQKVWEKLCEYVPPGVCKIHHCLSTFYTIDS